MDSRAQEAELSAKMAAARARKKRLRAAWIHLNSGIRPPKLDPFERVTPFQVPATLEGKEKAAGRLQPLACEVCGSWDRAKGHRSAVVYDHCHATGKFRGWLCAACNTAIGYVRDDYRVMIRLAAYLRQFAVEGKTTPFVDIRGEPPDEPQCDVPRTPKRQKSPSRMKL